MITLTQLRDVATQAFPNAHIDLVRLLAAWAMQDPAGELRVLLKDTGLEMEEMIVVLQNFLDTPSEEDRKLLVSCITGVTKGPVLGIHLLRALAYEPGHRITNALVKAGLSLDPWRVRLNEQQESRPGVLAQHGIKVAVQEDILLQYGRDLTALASNGSFDDLCDRPEELERVLQVLLRKDKGNCVLTGPAGIGKTALVELFARKLARCEFPPVLHGTKVFELSMGKLVAGTRYRGDFEERMDRVIQAMMAHQPAILFVDEMHLIWGAGRAEGVITDAANILKPFLARSSFRVIGATTGEEYRKYIAKDEALARRFQEIQLREPDENLTLEMLLKQADALAKHHKIVISKAMVEKAILLTNEHVSNRCQPDKSRDILDSAAVCVVRSGRTELSIADLLQILSQQTGRPVAMLTGDDRANLRNLADRLKSMVIGQDQAVERVVATLIQRRQGLGDNHRNLGTFLFAGDTGVGKTELARSIAKVFFGSDRALLHLDLAEYNESSGVNKLIGSPAGYVDSDREGVLIHWLHDHNSGVILFDEIEKAHADVHHLLLGLLESGRIHSSHGETLSTCHFVVILTTNAITSKDLNRGGTGFSRKSCDNPEQLLADHFPREFLGRLDRIILFNNLDRKTMRAVLKLRLDEVLARLSKRHIRVVFDENRLLDFLCTELESSQSGAREITRLLESKLLQPISLAMLSHEGEEAMAMELRDEFYENAQVFIKS